jgi:hypothetical protein
MLEDEMTVELVAVDSGEIVAPSPAVDELGRLALLVSLLGVDSEMLVASKEDEASTTEDEGDVTNSASVTDG